MSNDINDYKALAIKHFLIDDAIGGLHKNNYASNMNFVRIGTEKDRNELNIGHIKEHWFKIKNGLIFNSKGRSDSFN